MSPTEPVATVHADDQHRVNPRPGGGQAGEHVPPELLALALRGPRDRHQIRYPARKWPPLGY